MDGEITRLYIGRTRSHCYYAVTSNDTSTLSVHHISIVFDSFAFPAKVKCWNRIGLNLITIFFFSFLLHSHLSFSHTHQTHVTELVPNFTFIDGRANIRFTWWWVCKGLYQQLAIHCNTS